MSKKLTNDEFIEKSRQIHNNKYDYSKCCYVNNRSKVVITCPLHGDFEQLAGNHLAGYGCKKCAIEKTAMDKSTSFNDFVNKAHEIHNSKYFYYKESYINCNEKVKISCPEHGVFYQLGQMHLLGQGCPICGKEKAKEFLPKKKSTDDFIKKAKLVHGEKYDYSKVEYDGYNNNVIIICKKHGEFSQTPHNHLDGSGCPRCKRSVLEEKTANILDNRLIEYVDHVNKTIFKWLKNQHLDFYLPKYNVAIECQGIQHFEPVDYAGKGEDWAKRKLYTTKNLDKIKLKRCEENFINLEYINYNDNVEKRINEIIDKYENKENIVETPVVNADE